MSDVIEVRGERLVLRPLRSAEIDEEWQAMVTADPIGVGTLPDEATFRARLARSGTMRDGWLDLAIDLGGRSIGRIQTFAPPGRPLPPGTFDIGISLQRGARGKGYGREALSLFADWLFRHAGARVLEAGTDEANHAMRAVFRHVGWQEDGMLTEIGRDWVVYRITRADWEARQA